MLTLARTHYIDTPGADPGGGGCFGNSSIPLQIVRHELDSILDLDDIISTAPPPTRHNVTEMFTCLFLLFTGLGTWLLVFVGVVLNFFVHIYPTSISLDPPLHTHSFSKHTCTHAYSPLEWRRQSWYTSSWELNFHTYTATVMEQEMTRASPTLLIMMLVKFCWTVLLNPVATS